MEHTETLIRELELKLLDENTRKNKSELEKIISDSFVEYGSSGAVYHYDDILTFLLAENSGPLHYNILTFEVKQLSQNAVLALYVIETKKNNQTITTNRSSIWKKENDNWKIIFHQGTARS